jgi:4-amino-4-deoxy-L-arabinose transferase-like glycosyltransferase
MRNKLLQYCLLVLIVFLGMFLRIYNLDKVPTGFFCDEASIGYNAYSLLTTGKDEYGVSSPIFFQSFGDYRPPLAIYSAIPFVKMFGLNEFATRLPSVLYGLIIIIIMYFIGKEISSNKSRSFGLLTAFITATMPWLIHYNRTGFEFTIYAAFFTATVLLLLKTIHKKNFIIPAFIVAALTIYTYQPARLLIPLLILGFLFINRKEYLLYWKNTVVGLLSFFIFSIPLILSFLNGQGFARFNMVSVFSAKIPFIQIVLRIIQNYFIQLSPNYFIVGEPTFITRHFVGGLTPLLLTTLPFLLIGLIHTLLTIKNKKSSQMLLFWLLIYPIAGAVTADAPFTSRSIIGAPLFAILIGLGVTVTILRLKRFMHTYIILASFIILVMLLNLASFAKFYFIQYPLYSSDFWGWQYGPKEIIQYFVTNENKYDDLYMAGEFNAPEIFLKFYAPHDCQKCHIGIPDQNYIPGRKQLFAVTPLYITEHPSYRFKLKKTIYYPNQSIAFEIGEIVQ